MKVFPFDAAVVAAMQDGDGDVRALPLRFSSASFLGAVRGTGLEPDVSGYVGREAVGRGRVASKAAVGRGKRGRRAWPCGARGVRFCDEVDEKKERGHVWRH